MRNARTLEIWRAGGSNSGTSAELARSAEAEGWDGQMFMDSQCLSADPYAQMGAWACSTERLLLSTGVTNPFTRNLAVIAGAAATIQSISGGRSVLGIGRGDSALAYLGHAPVGLKLFGTAIRHLQTLLRGEEIPFDSEWIEAAQGEGTTSVIEEMSYDNASGAIAWTNKIAKPMKLSLKFTGKVDGDGMSGKVKAGFMGSFPFTARRR